MPIHIIMQARSPRKLLAAKRELKHLHAAAAPHILRLYLLMIIVILGKVLPAQSLKNVRFAVKPKVRLMVIIIIQVINVTLAEKWIQKLMKPYQNAR